MINKIKNFILGNMINIIIGIVTIPITTRLLSPEQYGIASFYETIITLFSLVSFLGIDQGFMRYYYEEKEYQRGDLLKKCIRFTGLIFLILIFISVILKKMKYVSINNDIYFLIILGSFIYILNRFTIIVIRMKQNIKFYSILITLNQVFKFLLIIIIYKKYGNDYKVIIYSSILASFITFFLGRYFEKESWKVYDKMKTEMKEIIKYSFPLCFNVLAIWIFQSSDKIMLKYLSNTYQLGIYSASFKIISILSLIQQGFTTFWTPIAYEKYTQDKNNLTFFNKIFNNIQILIFLGIILIFLIKDIIIYFLGTKYLEVNRVFPFLVFIPTMYLLSEITVLGLSFKKKSKLNMSLTIIVSLINIILNFLFIPNLGAIGAAISSGITYILFFVLRTFFSLKVLNFNFDLKKVYLGIILSVFYASELVFYDDNYINFLTGIIIIIILGVSYFKILKENFESIRVILKNRK